MSKTKNNKRLSLLAEVQKHSNIKRGLFTFGLIVLGALGVYSALSHLNTSSYALSDENYTCQATGTFASGHTGTAALTSNDTLAAAKAMQWIEGQTHTITTVTTDSTIQPNTEYADSYTGAIDGTFTLSGASYSTKNDAPLVVTSPSTVDDTYSGAIAGHVLTTPEAGRWIIQVYKKIADGSYVQVPKQALADGTTGDFSLDLSDISNPPAGQWAFGILDANNAYAPYGVQWPAPEYYDGLEVQQKLVTDNIYDWSTTHAYADGTFHFDNSNTGKKLLRLVDTASGNILAEYVKTTGLVRSYAIAPSDPTYGTAFANSSFVYDQAVALFAAVGSNNEALSTTLVDGLLNLQQTASPHQGAFVFSAPQLTPSYRDTLIRTGAHAIATDALLAYIQKYPSAANISLYTQRAEDALSFLDSVLSSSGTTAGLYTGGFGDYTGAGGSFDPNVVISWASTEHNIDIWQTLTRASHVLGNDSVDYAAKADTLKQAIMQKLYNTSENRYNQGMTATGADEANPLDVNSWGAIQLYASGETQKAITSLSNLTPFQFNQSGSTGYAAFYDSTGYPGALANIWYEGTFGVALAQLRVGDTNAYRTTINGVATAQHADGSFDYVTTRDDTYQLYPRASVASTAWYVLATTASDAIWNYCTYTPPATTPTTPSTPSTGSTSGTTQPQPSSASSAGTSSTTGSSTSEISQDDTTIKQETQPLTPQDSQTTASGDNAKDSSTGSARNNTWPSWLPIAGGIALVGIVGGAITMAIRRNKN